MPNFVVKIGTPNKGDYVAGAAYTPGDIVRFGTPASSYRNILASTDVAPTAGGDNANWLLEVSAGATGSAGTNGTNGNNGTNGVGYDGVTSTTSTAIATGNKTLAINKQGAFVIGNRVQLTNSATNYMRGVITAISAASVTVAVDVIGGTGTLASWTMSLAGGDITNITNDPATGNVTFTTA